MINQKSFDNSSLIFFLSEIRKRLLRCVLVLGLLFVVLFYFANDLYAWLALPLLNQLPHGHGLISTNVVAPFFVPFELTFVASFCLAMPYFLLQAWAFVAPALYRHEKKVIWPLLLASVLLFYVGIAFAYGVIFPVVFKFLVKTAPQGVMVSPDISLYLDFTLKLFLTFGVLFEIPIVTVVLVWIKVLKRQTLIDIRPYAIVSAFVIAMLLGPPDVISQTLLALPLYFLYEIGIFAAKFFD